MAYKYRPAVAVDLDGVILEYDDWRGPDHFGKPLPGAKKFLQDLREKGIRIIIHTARVNEVHDGPDPVDMASKIVSFLWREDLEFDEVWCGPGKPIALAYVDDRAIFMSSRVCQDPLTGWGSALAEISVAKGESDKRHEDAPGEIAE